MYDTFQVGSFRAIEPEAIQAQDGDSGINMTLTYSISAGKQQEIKASNSAQTFEEKHKNMCKKNILFKYCLCLVSPDKYQRNFNIDSSSGVLSVLTAIDREEMSSSIISVSIKVLAFKHGGKCATTEV